LGLCLRFAGSNPAETVGFFSGEKILNMRSFGREESRLPHVTDLLHVKEPCDYMKFGSQAKFIGHFSSDFFPR
jgi:hypothetical protein